MADTTLSVPWRISEMVRNGVLDDLEAFDQLSAEMVLLGEAETELSALAAVETELSALAAEEAALTAVADVSADAVIASELGSVGGVLAVLANAALSVTIPSVTDPDVGSVAVTFTGAAVGDVVLAADPTEALPTNCLFTNAYVSATDTVTFTFASVGGNITGAAKTFAVIIGDRTA